jgi:hypothetical protein
MRKCWSFCRSLGSSFLHKPPFVPLPDRHRLLTIRNLTPPNPDRMSYHERDYSEENSFQTCKRQIENAPVIPRIDPRLLRERKQFGVCRRGAVLCADHGNLRLADPCSRRRVK